MHTKATSNQIGISDEDEYVQTTKIRRGEQGRVMKTAGGEARESGQVVNSPLVWELRYSSIASTFIRMAFQASSPSWLAATLALLSFLSLLLPTNALYFYAEGRQPKCFYEDLPKDTLVAGMCWDTQRLYT